MTYFPVIIPTLNRYEHFKACVESLSACTHASQTELIIGLDFPPSNKYVEGWKKVQAYIPKIQGFKKVTCFERNTNLGSSKNSRALQDYALSKYDAYSIYMTVKQKYVLMPTVSLVRNTGWNESGEHCSKCGIKIKDIFSKQQISDKTVFDFNAAEKIEHSKNLEVFQLRIYEKKIINFIKANLILVSIKLFGYENSKKLRRLVKNGKN